MEIYVRNLRNLMWSSQCSPWLWSTVISLIAVQRSRDFRLEPPRSEKLFAGEQRRSKNKCARAAKESGQDLDSLNNSFDNLPWNTCRHADNVHGIRRQDLFLWFLAKEKAPILAEWQWSLNATQGTKEKYPDYVLKSLTVLAENTETRSTSGVGR